MRRPFVYQLTLSVTLFLGLVLGGALSPRGATAATYYVATTGSDVNPGTFFQPFRTIAKGVQSLHGGDTLYIRRGTYVEGIAARFGVIPPSGTSWSQATTIAGYPNETVTLAPTAGAAVVELPWNGELSYIIFANLILDGVGAGGMNNVVFFANNNHIRFINSEMKNAGSVNISGAGGYNEVINCRIHNAKFYGFYYAGHDSLFEHNEVYDNGGYAYHIYEASATHVSNNIIRHNTIHGNGLTCPLPGCHGGVILSHGSNNQADHNVVYDNFAGIQVDYLCTNCQVSNNTIYGNSNSGIAIGPEAFNTLVENNILYDNGFPIDDQGVGTILRNNSTTAP
jgi:parallel beta-helix repeat protein